MISDNKIKIMRTLNNKGFFLWLSKTKLFGTCTKLLMDTQSGILLNFEHDDGSLRYVWVKLFLISWTHRGFIFKLTFKGLFPHLTSWIFQSMNPIEVWRMPYLDISPKSIKVLTEKDISHCLSCGSAFFLYGFLLSVCSLKEKKQKLRNILKDVLTLSPVNAPTGCRRACHCTSEVRRKLKFLILIG